jgi:hypothetical protein
MSDTKDVAFVKIPDKRIMLYTFDGGKELNIYPQVRSFDIIESLDNYTVTAEFFIADGIELINTFPLGGEEKIKITLQTPSRDSISYEFHVESIRGMQTNDQSNLRSYVLVCATKDFLKNGCTVFSKRYTDLKYSDALKTCLTEDLSSSISLETIEDTKGKFDYVVNNVRPFQVVDLIKERAVSTKNKSSVFVFYQDNKGYHFQTIEKLITDRKGGAPGKKFYMDTANRVHFADTINARNILKYEVISQGSSIDKVYRGAIRNEYREFDIHRGTYYPKQKYINQSMFSEFEATDDKNDFNSSAYNGFAGKQPAVTRMLVKDGLRPDMQHNENVHYKRAFFERMKQASVRIRVYGDTSLRVGDVIELEIPEISGKDSPKPNKIFSKNYIITDLKHRADQKANGDFEHYCIIQCTKPNQYGKPLG